MSRIHESLSSLIERAGYVSLANRASFNSNERAYTMSNSSSSRAGIERVVECVGSFTGLRTFMLYFDMYPFF
jgi:hypothetical protein